MHGHPARTTGNPANSVASPCRTALYQLVNMHTIIMDAQKSSRDIILGRIRASHPSEVAHPEVPMYGIEGDPVDNFIRHLESFDGKAMRFASRSEALDWLEKNIDRTGKRVYSSASDYEGNIADSEVADPHNAHIVDVCVGEGVIGVGETGSVYVTDESLGLAACALFSTDLYLLLERSRIVDGMHTAYRMIDLRANRYGSFFTGPSATADIEAVRVTGAQGEISLTTLIFG